MRRECPLCAGTALASLPAPRADAAMLSDGRIFPRALRRLACEACGAAFHDQPVDAAEARRWFAEGYALSGAAPEADAARARAYAAWILEALAGRRPRRVVEAGAGSGALLRELARALPEASLAGCEPSQAAAETREGRLALHRGGLEALPAEPTAELAIAVNVIEHTPDPVEFLRALAARLAPGGAAVVVCPDGGRPNLELLFLDHLWSFTDRALRAAAARAGLSVASNPATPPALGDFRLYILARDGGSDGGDRPHAALPGEREAYLRTWSRLDEALGARLPPGGAAAFGAGQMAALLRAYAPATWARLGHLELDRPGEAWSLGLQARAYDPAAREPLLLAVAPAAHATLATRIRRDGRAAVRFDDLVAR